MNILCICYVWFYCKASIPPEQSRYNNMHNNIIVIHNCFFLSMHACTIKLAFDTVKVTDDHIHNDYIGTLGGSCGSKWGLQITIQQLYFYTI